MNEVVLKNGSFNIDNDNTLLTKVLEPYFLQTQYLKSGVLSVKNFSEDDCKMSISCNFGFSESFYIADTGHFNAVEFNLCFNQMIYYFLALGIKNNILEAFNKWSLDDFFRKQLKDVFIKNFFSTFKAPINPNNFYGNLTLIEMSRREGDKPRVYLKVSCEFYDDTKGLCEGSVDLVILDDVN